MDYQKLNHIMIKDRYALPLIEELQATIAGAKPFTKLDLKEAYHQVQIKEGDEWKTAFRTQYGQYEYCVMPLGLSNAPATFQRLINNIMRVYLDNFIVAYLNDILVFSQNLKEHIQHVRKVLKKLDNWDLTISPEKSEFHKSQIEFLLKLITCMRH